MALTFPLAPSEWMDKLAVEEITFDTDMPLEASETAAGEYMVKRLGPTLWRGSVMMFAHRYDCGAGRAALLGALRRPGASFLVYNKFKQFPADDPDGAKLGAAVPTITNITSVGDVTIGSFPPLYRLTAGDYIGWQYGADPVRYALHRVVKDNTAQGSGGGSPGRMANIIVDPLPRAGWVAGTPVTVIRPVCKAVIVPGSVSEATFGRVAMAGLSFRWQQTLR